MTQADVDAIAAELANDEQKFNDFVTAVGAHEADLQKQIDDLKNANPALDLSALQATAQALTDSINAAKP